MTRLLILLSLCAASALAQCSSTTMNPITGKLDCIGAGAISVNSLTDGATVNTSTRPTFHQYTCDDTIAVNSLVQVSGNFIVPADGTLGVLGIARAACVGTGTTTVAELGIQDAVAEGAITADHLLIPGTIDPTRVKDSGTTDIGSIPTTTPVVGIARAAASNGATFSVVLHGPHHFGTQVTSSTPPDVVSVTGGSTTTVDIPLNTTVSNCSKVLVACATSGRVFFTAGGHSCNAGLDTVTATFSPSAPSTGSCTAILTGAGGGGGGGGGDFSSNTATSVDGEVVLFSGTGGKTGKRANASHAVVKLTSGVMGAAAAADVVGLFSGCSGQEVLAADGTCIAGGGGSYTAGTGLTLVGSEFSLDSATGRTHITGSNTIDLGALAAPPSATACRAGTITVTGAATGDAVIPAWPSGATTMGGLVTGAMWVSATDTVSVQLCYLGTGTFDPASATFGATVQKTF